MPDHKQKGDPIQVRDGVPPSQRQVGRGILNGFKLATVSGLAPTVTEGDCISACGQTKLRKISGSADSKFPSVTASTTARVYMNSKTGAISYRTDDTPTNPFDIYVGLIINDGTDITEVRRGEWLNAQDISFGVCNLAATGYRNGVDYHGNPTYYTGATVIPITDFTTTTGTLLIRRVTRAGTASTIDTLSLTNQTAAPEDVALAPNIRSLPTPVLILPGERLLAQVSVAAGGGTGIVCIHLGGGLKQ